MAISVTFYKNDKRINSTKLPVSSVDDIVLQVELKDVTSLYTPSLIISAERFMENGHIKNPMRYNYCYIPDFERYYFVRSWNWILGRWECALEIDVMASFKTEIGNSTCMVLRSASQYDPDIIDTKYPTLIDYSGALQEKGVPTTQNIWNVDIENATIDQGFFLISVVNDDVNAVGGMSHYALSASTMAELMNKLYSAPTWMNITDANISQDLQKMLMNPVQYINTCMWIPTGYTGGTGVHTIPIGWWSITLTGTAYRLDVNNCIKTINFGVNRQLHPQYDANKRRWLLLSPYTEMALYIPPFGFIPIDTTKCYRSTFIDVTIRLDVITGKGTLLVGHKWPGGYDPVDIDGGLIYTDVAQIGVPISVAQMSVDWNAITSASTWAGAAGVTLAMGGLQESIKNLKNGLVDGAKNFFGEGGTFNRWAAELGERVFGGDVGSAISGGLYNALTTTLPQGHKKYGSSPGGAAGSESSLLSSLKEIAGDIGSTALAAAGTCKSSGSTGGFAALQEPIFLQYYFQLITGIDDEHLGLPLCRSVKINTLSGFVLCGNTDSFTANCTPAERQAVCAIMEAGFYYE